MKYDVEMRELYVNETKTYNFDSVEDLLNTFPSDEEENFLRVFDIPTEVDDTLSINYDHYVSLIITAVE